MPAVLKDGLVQAVVNADTAQVPDIIGKMAEYRKWADPLLRQENEKAAVNSRQKLHASLALLPVDPGQVDLEDLHPPTGFNAFEVKTGNDPVIRKPECVPLFLIEWHHPVFFRKRTIASFSRRDSALIAASRFNARLRLARDSWYTSLTGRRLRVYRDAAPALCCWQRRITSLAIPV